MPIKLYLQKQAPTSDLDEVTSGTTPGRLMGRKERTTEPHKEGPLEKL